MMTLVNFVTSFSTDWSNWTNLLGDGNSPGTYYSFQDLAQEVHGLWYWLTPRNPDNISATGLGLWDYIWYIAQEVSSMWGGWDSYFSNLTALPIANNLLTNLQYGLSNINPEGISYTIGELRRNAHRALVSIDTTYSLDFFNKLTGALNSNTYNWNSGSPLGNIALILQKLNQNTVNIAETFLKNYNDTLTTWEHSTNTQTSFTPTSLANGLYRYLAYIQSDTTDWDYNGKLGLTNYFWDTLSGWTIERKAKNANRDLLTQDNTSNYTIPYYTGGIRQDFSTQWRNGTPIGNLALINRLLALTSANGFQNLLYGFNNSQTAVYWNTAQNQANAYTPISAITGIYYWLQNMQIPLARLAFVHADDNDIAAKRGTAANEQTITNNFLSTSGSAAATASDYGALASASGSFKQNFNTGASATGIFDLFNGDYASSWFSQETANQLDSNNAVRSIKGGVRTVTVSEYDTPLLNSYYSDIMSIFNKKSDDYSEYVNYIDESIYPAQGVQEEGVIID